jgi:hypothetical protein
MRLCALKLRAAKVLMHSLAKLCALKFRAAEVLMHSLFTM